MPILEGNLSRRDYLSVAAGAVIGAGGGYSMGINRSDSESPDEDRRDTAEIPEAPFTLFETGSLVGGNFARIQKTSEEELKLTALTGEGESVLDTLGEAPLWTMWSTDGDTLVTGTTGGLLAYQAPFGAPIRLTENTLDSVPVVTDSGTLFTRRETREFTNLSEHLSQHEPGDTNVSATTQPISRQESLLSSHPFTAASAVTPLLVKKFGDFRLVILPEHSHDLSGDCVHRTGPVPHVNVKVYDQSGARSTEIFNAHVGIYYSSKKRAYCAPFWLSAESRDVCFESCVDEGKVDLTWIAEAYAGYFRQTLQLAQQARIFAQSGAVITMLAGLGGGVLGLTLLVATATPFVPPPP